MSSPTAFSWRGLLQSLFDVEDDALGSRASPLAAAPTPRWSRRSAGDAGSRSPSASSANGDASEDEEAMRPYAVSRLDGEFNVWFACKPLGLGLVPSTQLYGTWEISSVASDTHRSDDAHERAKIQRGDVVVAVNFNARAAKLPRDAFAAYLQRSACPVVVTLRRPALYGSFDSRAMSTAMFPASTEYRGKNTDLDHKTFLARAPSMQWKRSLQHELKQKKKKQEMSATHGKKNVTPSGSPRKTRGLEPTPEMDPSSGSSSPSDAVAAGTTHRGSVEVATRPRNLSTAELTPMGEFTATFHEVPLRVSLSPSTRLYGSVEVYDASHYAPLIQIGDVVMAVNGDASVAKWPTDDAIDHVAALLAPVTITFRRPSAYRKYLETYFKTNRAQVSSRSTATAMFPDSAEYKHGHYRLGKTKNKNVPTTLVRRGSIANNGPNSLIPAASASEKSRVEGQGKMTKQEWQRVSKALSSSDQFKLWQSGASKRDAAKKKKKGNLSAQSEVATSWLQTSAFLTERHVHYLWAHLPEYLTCNDMELVFDTRHHGWNILSFYAHVEGKGPTLLVVKDTRDQIFGAFSSTSWKPSADVYGNGRCFVFSLRPQMKVYAWSGLDDTFMFGRNDALMMGGGKKGMALCIQLDELRGFSHACDTFDSPPLAPVSQEGGAFEMENMEVWCFSGLRV